MLPDVITTGVEMKNSEMMQPAGKVSCRLNKLVLWLICSGVTAGICFITWVIESSMHAERKQLKATQDFPAGQLTLKVTQTAVLNQ